MTPTQKPAELLISQKIDLIAHILWSCLFALLPLFSCNFDTREGGLSLHNLMQSFFWSSPILIALFRGLPWCSFELSLPTALSVLLPPPYRVWSRIGLPAASCRLGWQKELVGMEQRAGGGVVTKRHGRWENEWLFRRAFFACFLGCSLPTNSPEEEEHARRRTSLLPVLALRKVTFGVRRQRATRERASSGNKVRILFCCNVLMLAHSTLWKMTRGYSVAVAGVLARRVLSW